MGLKNIFKKKKDKEKDNSVDLSNPSNIMQDERSKGTTVVDLDDIK